MKELIVRETEKAVAIENGVYLLAQETASYDIKELSSEQIEALRTQHSLIWFPKSQVTIQDGYIVDMPDWLAYENNLVTNRMAEANRKKFADACERYNKALCFAKENGLKVRNKMKLKTILNAIKKAGLEFEF